MYIIFIFISIICLNICIFIINKQINELNELIELEFKSRIFNDFLLETEIKRINEIINSEVKND
jgi:hypothetical protein